MRDDFRICLGDKLMALRGQLMFQRQIVFDNPVMHHDDAACAIAMGMRILFCGSAMRSPACVADAIGAMHRLLRQHCFQIFQLARSATQLHPVFSASHGDACRIIAAILQPPQPFKNDRDGIFAADISDDATHSLDSL